MVDDGLEWTWTDPRLLNAVYDIRGEGSIFIHELAIDIDGRWFKKGGILRWDPNSEASSRMPVAPDFSGDAEDIRLATNQRSARSCHMLLLRTCWFTSTLRYVR